MFDLDHFALQASSEAFGNRLPDNWDSLEDSDREAWLDCNKSEAFESISNSEYFELIDTHADTIKRAIKGVLDHVKDALIDAAIECELPSDFNELDLQSMAGLRG